MGLLGPLASLLGIETDLLLHRIKESAVAFAAIGLFVVIAFSFMLVALYNYLLTWIGPIWAPLAIAGGSLLIAFVLFIALQIQTAAIKEREAQNRREIEANVALAATALSVLPELLKSPLLRSVGIPVGLYVGFLMLTRSRKPATGAASDSAES